MYPEVRNFYKTHGLHENENSRLERNKQNNLWWSVLKKIIKAWKGIPISLQPDSDIQNIDDLIRQKFKVWNILILRHWVCGYKA